MKGSFLKFCLLLVGISPVLISCKLNDNSLYGSISDSPSSPSGNGSAPSKLTYEPQVQFTGLSDSSVDPEKRVFDENDDPAWVLTGSCDPDLGNVTIKGDIDSSQVVACGSSGTFRMAIGYDGSSPSPYFSTANSRETHFLRVFQGNVSRETWVYKTNSGSPPTFISTVAQLQAMTPNNTGVFYILKNDLNVAAETGNATNNWTPVGNPGSAQDFRGSFDGNGHTISNIHIGSGNWLGLFGETRLGAVITNVHLKNIQLNGTNRIGGIAGETDSTSTLINILVEGTITGQTSVGGISGSSDNANFENIHFNGNINGSTTGIGGLIGSSSGGLIIKRASASATINAGTASRVGGLVGSHSYVAGVDIRNSYFKGTINGDSDVGGQVGYESALSGASYLVSVFSSADITVNSGNGEPLIGSVNSLTPTISGAYYVKTPDKNCTGCNLSSYGSGISLNQLKTQSTFTGWDFSNTWFMAKGLSHPELRFQPNASFAHAISDFNGVLVKGEAAKIMSPVYLNDVSSFSISPTLPSGLQFDTSTGSIYGTPTSYLRNQTFTITARNDHGSKTGTINLSVGIRFTVNDMGTDSDSGVNADEACDNGSGQCTLRAAIEEAAKIKADMGDYPTVIEVPHGTIDIDTGANPGSISITSNIIIQGAGPGKTVIEGDGLDPFPVFQISSSAELVELTGLTIQNISGSTGGAISSQAKQLNLSHCEIKDNTITGNFAGLAALSATGGVLIEHCLIDNNQSTGSSGREAMRTSGSYPTIIRHSTISNNTSNRFAGALSIETSSKENLIEYSIFASNAVNSGIPMSPSAVSANYLTIRHSTFDSNGVGSSVIAIDNGELKVESSTFSNNSRLVLEFDDTSFISDYTYDSLTNSTFYNNSNAVLQGEVGRVIRVNHSSFLDNDLALTTLAGNAVDFIVSNSLISSSTQNCNFALGSTIQSGGFNIVSDTSCNSFGMNASTDQANTDPLFDGGGLVDNGGSTKTLTLQSTSPAIDLIDAVQCSLKEDQRGFSRPVDSGGGLRCDSGSVEMN